MGASRTQTAKNAAGTATTNASGYGATAAGENAVISPVLNRQAQGGGGYTPTQQNNMLVAGEQGAGGANAGITGTANLEAARTHNTGALSGVLDQAARQKQQTLSQNALNVQNKSADLANQQQQSALKELGGLYGTNVGAQTANEKLVPEDLQAEAPNNYQDILGGVNSAAGLISAYKKPGGGGQGG
jgi:hypothetical protein